MYLSARAEIHESRSQERNRLDAGSNKLRGPHNRKHQDHKYQQPLSVDLLHPVCPDHRRETKLSNKWTPENINAWHGHNRNQVFFV